MGRGDALDVAPLHRSLGVVANLPASSEQLPTYGSCYRPPALARLASGITASIWFQVALTLPFSFRQQDNNRIVLRFSERDSLLWGFRVCGVGFRVKGLCP